MSKINDLKELIDIFSGITNAAEMEILFQELFTESEIKDVALRWRLMKELESGIPQREIAAKYNLSLCKITRGSKILKQKNSICKKLLTIKEK